MSEKSPVKGRTTYLVGPTPRAESAIFGSGCGGLGALKQHLLGVFVRSIEEPAQGLVLCQIEPPQFEGPLLAWEDPADKHALDYVDELEVLVDQLFDAGLESGQLFQISPC